MTLRATCVCLSTMLGLALTATLARADSTLYENGPQGPDADAWNISSGFAVSDSFALSTTAQLTQFRFFAWLIPHDSLTSAELSITSQPFGGTAFFDQVVDFTQLECSVNAYGYDVCDESASFNGPALGTGVYFVNLQNAQTQNGDPVLWDENSGVGCHSPGCPSQAYENMIGAIPSESFTMLGNSTTGTTPEPSTAMLVGSGVLALLPLRRVKRLDR